MPSCGQSGFAGFPGGICVAESGLRKLVVLQGSVFEGVSDSVLRFHLMATKKERLLAAANAIAEELDADVLFLTGGLDSPNERKFADLCAKRATKRPNVFLIPVTHGGSAHVAYRLARCLQRSYEHITACVPGPCGSAGTLLVIGAHDLIVSDHGTLGPLDVQIRKADELGEATSGLTAMEALTTLRSASFEMFEANLFDLKMHSGGSVTLKTAMDIASRLTVGLFEPMYEQIDPMRLGEDGRLVKIALEYGSRLDGIADNLGPGALEKLVSKYPTHTFEIDREEAEGLFYRVAAPSDAQVELIAALGSATEAPSNQTNFFYLSAEKKADAKENKNAEDSANPSGAEQAIPEDSADDESLASEKESGGIPARFVKSIG